MHGQTVTPPLTNIRLPRNPLIGRDHEIAEVKLLLLQPQVGLLTLTGPGGIGKTRLALQVAAGLLDDFADGVHFVSLAPIRTPDLVIAAIAQVLGVHDAAGRPLQESLEDYLKHREMLLVLDNFEHLAAAAPLAAALLASCRRLKLLVTSRVTLHLYEEHEFPVPLLALPDSECLASVKAGRVTNLAQVAAVELFIQRGETAAKPDFAFTAANATAVAKICLRLDGLPLAIELAAARIKIFPPAALLARLQHRLALLTGGAHDLPVRQRTLRDEIGWSYDLLAPGEQLLFRSLSVFVGGFTLIAAQAMGSEVGGLLPASPQALATGLLDDVLDQVTSLVEQNLLRQEQGPDGDPRFTMLETIQEFGLEQLTACGEREEICRRHANFFLKLAEASEALLLGSQREATLAQLQAEINNFRTAFMWSQSAVGSEEVGLRLAGALTWFWHFGNHVNEAHGWFELLSASLRRSTPTTARAKALWGAGMIDMIQGDYQLAQAKLEESASLWRHLGDQLGVGVTLRELCAVELFQGQLVAARHGEESVNLCRAMDSRWDLALAHYPLGSAINAQGDPVTALALFEECYRLFRTLEDAWGIAVALGALGFVAGQNDDYATARTLFEEVLAIRRTSADKWNIAEALNLLGEVVQRQGELEEARKLFVECLALVHEVGDKAHIALVLHHLGVIAQLQNRPERAAQLLAAAASLRQRVSGAIFITFTTATENEEVISTVHTALGEEAFSAEWQQGQAMGLEQAIEYALAPLDLSEATPPTMAPGTLPPSPPAYPMGLTAREVDVLRLVAQGLTYAQIAERLVISWRTVNTHLTSIYSKLGVTSRKEAAHFAVKHQI